MTETTKPSELEAGFSGAAPLLGLPEKRWERGYYNSYGNYSGYRFQNFRAQCEHRDDDGGGCNPACRNKGHPYARDEEPECCCDFCPLVVKDYDDEDPDEPDYSEGEQPILVLKPNAQAVRKTGQRGGAE